MKLNAFNKPKGWIEVICGPMFAGKSEEMLRRINRFKYADIDFIVFKPVLDTRTKSTAKSRDGRELQAIEVSSSNEILSYLSKTNKHIDAIAIDEAHFFDDNLGDVCNDLANRGFVILVSGLDLDYKGVPFMNVAKVQAYADYVTKLTAICKVCGGEANRTQFIVDDKTVSNLHVGDSESYEARCRQHHKVKA